MIWYSLLLNDFVLKYRYFAIFTEKDSGRIYLYTIRFRDFENCVACVEPYFDDVINIDIGEEFKIKSREGFGILDFIHFIFDIERFCLKYRYFVIFMEREDLLKLGYRMILQ